MSIGKFLSDFLSLFLRFVTNLTLIQGMEGWMFSESTHCQHDVDIRNYNLWFTNAKIIFRRPDLRTIPQNFYGSSKFIKLTKIFISSYKCELMLWNLLCMFHFNNLKIIINHSVYLAPLSRWCKIFFRLSSLIFQYHTSCCECHAWIALIFLHSQKFYWWI
jgi:hypothetical protein